LQMSQNIAMELRRARGHRFLWPGRIYPNSGQHGCVCVGLSTPLYIFPKASRDFDFFALLFLGESKPTESPGGGVEVGN
jgi:hypothetical protein